MTTTLLFPHLTFGCNGTIVRLTVAVAADSNSERGQSAPKIQIWKENGSLYQKLGPEILILNSSCEDLMLNEGKFQCTLSESARVSVQPGDILGIEIPPVDNGYKILFINASSHKTNTRIFLQRLPSSTLNLSEADNITSHLPQIIPLVILGNYIPHMLCIPANH